MWLQTVNRTEWLNPDRGGRKMLRERMRSGLAFAVVLMMLATVLAFVPAQTNASSTIYIRPDGSVDPATAPIRNHKDNYRLTADIQDFIVVEKSGITLNGDGHTIQGPGSGNGIYLGSVSDVTVKGFNLLGFRDGVQLKYATDSTVKDITVSGVTACGVRLLNSDHNTIKGNTFTDNFHGVCVRRLSSYNMVKGNFASDGRWGIHLGMVEYNTIKGNVLVDNMYGIAVKGSSHNVIKGNTASGSWWGIWVQPYSNSNEIYENTVQENGIGVYLYHSSNDNRIYHNNLIDNNKQAEDYCNNMWDDGYPSGGNHWSDYAGDDLYSGPNQDEPGSDGIGDTPRGTGTVFGNDDRYPLMEPYE